jgi:hypothetical protein
MPATSIHLLSELLDANAFSRLTRGPRRAETGRNIALQHLLHIECDRLGFPPVFHLNTQRGTSPSSLPNLPLHQYVSPRNELI